MANRHIFQSIIIVLYVSAVCMLGSEQFNFDKLSRHKRTLIWPEGASRIQVIVGFGVPVDLKRETVIFGTVMKANYRFPTNASQLIQPYIQYERRKRGASRWNIYSALAQATEMRGMGGKSCILRAICEVAQTPLEKNYGLFDELMHAVFTPTTTNEHPNHHADNEYYAAQRIGKKNGKCEKFFGECKASLMDMFTVYKNSLL